ncbi:gluconokinase [Segniliparus rugosus]|uniref:Gluconokinase n=1 Tax=Segniliparus rugosus (strain ATCC BAA-974 / DSM 45345 / CCUG 50838 / CIP 108380 / JCM 13579 / CDC 945) TaxID=679197 RepID=E5XTL2_SEGRC|nr:gluconokinase [Segniliparus rugosus]EFV12327.1 thermoresistant glucokinase family carbohydrate kinase [Segniliparus rugosus ATCC BAA-974]
MAVVVVMGVSGCGKSTIAGLLAEERGWDLLEGDQLHPPENIAKMSAGIPLADEDRWPWLAAVAAWIRERSAVGADAVVSCSALKRAYRDRLRGGSPEGEVVFAHLDGPCDVLAERMAHRAHFMPASLLDSQLADLERLGPDEPGLVVDLRQSPQEQAAAILSWLGREQKTQKSRGQAR